MSEEAAKAGEIVPLRPAKAKQKQASEKKWGQAVMKLGFSIVPSLLLRAQQRLGVTTRI